MEYALFQAIDRLIRPLKFRISSLIQIGIIHKKTNTGMQISLDEGDTQDGVREYAHFGFASHPPALSEALLFFPGGNREIGLCIATRSKEGCPMELKEGESAQYNDQGAFIALRQGGKFEFRNQEAELISVLCELATQVEKLSQLSAIAPPGGNYPGGQCTITVPGFNISTLKSKLDSFRTGS